MNKRTHIRLGRIVCQFAESELGIRLDRGGFIFGNILPDLCLSFVTRPHTVDHTLGLVSRKIRRLSAVRHDDAYIGRSFSRRLGVICHYYADFFCYPHSRRYTGDLKDHVIYEKALYRYIDEAYGAADAEALCGGRVTLSVAEDAGACLQRLQNDYGVARPSFDQDLRYAILACLQAVFTLTGGVCVPERAERETFEPIPRTA